MAVCLFFPNRVKLIPECLKTPDIWRTSLHTYLIFLNEIDHKRYNQLVPSHPLTDEEKVHKPIIGKESYQYN